MIFEGARPPGCPVHPERRRHHRSALGDQLGHLRCGPDDVRPRHAGPRSARVRPCHPQRRPVADGRGDGLRAAPGRGAERGHPRNVFLVIASVATFATVWVWLMILLAHLRMKQRIRREGMLPSEFPVPLWPGASVATLVFLVFVIGVLGWFEDTRIALVVGVVWIALLLAAYQLCVRGPGRLPADLVDETGPIRVVRR
ncbi:hypothetical protein [Leifsonia xyli]